ncbi:MAG: sensor N-terminal transmembrane domain-containing protein, partial [Candidatus Puniceispirillaceae bacterium]
MSGKLNIKRKGISLLTVRILAIMIFPLFVFLAGFLAIDSYRITLIEAELEALERQGLTMARSLALEEARRFPNSPRQLSPETMCQLLPLVGYGSSLRARVFDTNG